MLGKTAARHTSSEFVAFLTDIRSRLFDGVRNDGSPERRTNSLNTSSSLRGFARRIEAGKRVAVTAHGRVVAELVPPGGRSSRSARYEELVAAGVIVPAAERNGVTLEWPIHHCLEDRKIPTCSIEAVSRLISVRRSDDLGSDRTIYSYMVLLLPTMKTRDLDTALQAFHEKGGTLRTRDLIAFGVHTDALYALRDSGRIVELGRGLYRLAEASETDHPDLAVVAARAPNAAVCLISALSYHGITTQIPSSIHLAVPRGSYHGIKLSMPVTVYRFDPKTFNEGIEMHPIGGMPLKIYSAARTVVDCFKFRNKVGLDVALEALRLARQRKRVQNRELLHYARLLRVERPMSPYLQAIE